VHTAVGIIKKVFSLQILVFHIQRISGMVKLCVIIIIKILIVYVIYMSELKFFFNVRLV